MLNFVFSSVDQGEDHRTQGPTVVEVEMPKIDGALLLVVYLHVFKTNIELVPHAQHQMI